jgi:septum site-determining protein MinC
MHITQQPKIKTTFQLKGGMYTLTTIRLLQYDLSLFCKQLNDKIKSSPKFFENAPIMLDLCATTNIHEVDLELIAQSLQDLNMILVGVKTQNQIIKEKARQLKLAVFNHNTPAPDEKHTIKTQVHNKTKVITQPVRSGQQIYAKNCDLIILSSVSQGAEIIADGNIHVYGALRGRALAGVSGDSGMYIFCHHFDAELIAIAGLYMVSEDLQKYKQKQGVKVYLDDNRLMIEPLVT